MKILIITPEIHRLGGVANHYLGLLPHWSLNVNYTYCGKRNDNESRITTLFHYIFDYLHFFFTVSQYDVVVVNPSLRKFQILRDTIYIRMAKLFKRKVVTFIHGFDYNFFEQLKASPRRFVSTFNYSSFIYVLYSDFGLKLKEIGIRTPILQTTTKVSDDYLDAINKSIPRENLSKLLFVGRLVKEKGITESIRVFESLASKHPDISFIICGDGPELIFVREKSTLIKGHLMCRGMIVGNDLAREYVNGDVLILLSYGEGLATCILEAMAFGLVIITTPVGGVQDFFEEGKMGYMVDKDDTQGIISKLEYLKNNPNILKSISTYNKEYAKEHFMASSVTKKFEKDLIQYCNENEKD